MIDSFHRQRVPELMKQFRAAAPFPHLVLDDFFESQVCADLIAEFPPFDDDAARDELGRAGGKCTYENVKSLGPAYSALDRFIQSREFLGFVEGVTGIRGLIYDPDYFGGGTHENRSGQGLDAHVDFNYHPITKTHRRLNLIVYFNDGWRKEWGGSIQLHSDPWSPATDEIKTVLPLRNRCLIFETSERSWHGFQPIQPSAGDNSRRSFALYLYTKDRPREETVPPHDTFYVQDPLPEFVRDGHVLDAGQVERLRGMLARRDQWIQYLYRKEMRYRGQIQRLEGSGMGGMFRQAAGAIAPLGSRRRRALDRLFRRDRRNGNSRG